MIPLWTTATRPLQSRWGWAFNSVGCPWVAHRVWPIPAVTPVGAFSTILRRSSRERVPRGGPRPVEAPAVVEGHAGRVVSPVLEPLQALEEEIEDTVIACGSDDSAHRPRLRRARDRGGAFHHGRQTRATTAWARSSSAASTMTRTRGSVPLARRRTRPRWPSSPVTAATSARTSALSTTRAGSTAGMFTRTWGRRRMTSETSSASGRPVRRSRSRRRTAVRTPSPVVASSRKTRCPDCSPPRVNPSAFRASRTYRSPIGVSLTAIPFSSMASRKPRFDMTVTTTVLPASRPRPARSVAKRARSSSPVVAAPVWSTATSRSASPSSARPTSAPLATTAAPTRSGWVDPQPSLMLVPSGSRAMASTVAPRRSRTRGATDEAAPLAQSTTTRIPASERPSRAATRCST